MKEIQIHEYLSSGLNPAFHSITIISIEDNHFDSGAFGKIYHCAALDGQKLADNQVIKLFLDDGSGSALRGYETIKKLQAQIVAFSKKKGNRQIKKISNVNALKALPQFSFSGLLDGNLIYGYSANFLAGDKWLLFDKIFNEEDLGKRNELLNTFYKSHITQRYKMAYDLAEGFYYLEQLNFIYADLNTKNFFVNHAEAKICLIDYEGGAINDNPETYGKPGEWLAPEIQEQLVNEELLTIKVNLNADTWSLGIAIHFMFFNYHPLFFLSVKGPKETKAYIAQNKWPQISTENPNFRYEKNEFYRQYVKKLETKIPSTIKAAFEIQINEGLFNPTSRITSRQWMEILSDLIPRPDIVHFRSDRNFVLKNGQALLAWKVLDAEILLLDNNIGEVTGTEEISVTVGKLTKYTLKAIGRTAFVEESVTLNIIPIEVMEHLRVSMPVFAGKITLPDIETIFPKKNNLIEFDGQRKIILPNIKIELNPLEPIKLTNVSSNNSSISVLFNSLKKKLLNN